MNSTALLASGLALVFVAGASAAPRFHPRAGSPLAFEPNSGQVDSRVKFLSRGRGHTLLLAPNEAVLTLPRGALRMKFAGANRTPRMAGVELLPGASNYFLGNDPARWRTNIPNYARVRYEDVYPGVDLVYHGVHQELEYDFIVSPAADPAVIRLQFEGARSLRLDDQGDLLLETAGGQIRQRRPVVYQELAHARRLVAGRYVLKGKREVGFQIGAYDRSRPLVIDPVLRLSSYLGGGSEEAGAGIAADASGNAFIVGTTSSANFPTAGPLQSRAGGKDVFVTKVNPAGGIAYSTYLGGSADDTGAGITVDAAGNVYVTGTTFSTNFPATNGALRMTLGGSSDAFVAKLDASGSKLTYSTLLGGGDADLGAAIAIDASGSAYITGTTNSSDLATPGAFRIFLSGTTDAFVAKLHPEGSALSYATFLGGSEVDQGFGITVDVFGNAYVTGSTFSTNFPTANALQPACALIPTPFGAPCSDAFVAKLNATGSTLVYSTYLGGTGADSGRSIAVDSSGTAYVTGVTGSTNYHTTAGAIQSTSGGGPDAFVTRMNAAGSGFVYSTYLGGSGEDQGNSITIDALGNAYVAGVAASTNFPTANPLQTTCATAGGSACVDAFVAKLNSTGSSLAYSTFFGGAGSDRAQGIAVDPSGFAYVTGETASANFPTAGAFQSSSGGATDAFVVVIGENNPIPALSSLSPSSAIAGGPGFPLTVTGTGFVPGAVVRWNGADRTTTFSSGTRVTASIAASDIALAGVAQVTVFNPGPGGGTSSALAFTIGSNPVALLSAISPASATAGDPGFLLSVTGSGFVPGSGVRWNGSDRLTTFINAARVQAAIPATDIASGGTAQVTVFNPAPGGGTSIGLTFTINNPLPAISSLLPASVPARGPAFTLAVMGSNFVSGSVVRWNGNPRATTFVSNTELRASIPGEDIVSSGSALVTVVNPPPGGGSSSVVTFPVTATAVVSAGGTVNAASFSNQPLAAGAIAAVFGSNLASVNTQAATTPLPTTLGGVTLRLDGVAAPLFFVSPFQINFLVPWELQGRIQTTLTVESGGITTAPQTVSLASFGPALFATNQRGTGQGTILIAGTGALAAPTGAFPGSRPVNRGEFLEIYCVGLGSVTNQPPTGAPAGSSPLSTTTVIPTVTIGGVPATVTFSGLAAGFVALYQVNAQVPDTAPTGSAVPVALTMAGVPSNTVTVAVQ